MLIQDFSTSHTAVNHHLECLVAELRQISEHKSIMPTDPNCKIPSMDQDPWCLQCLWQEDPWQCLRH
eukprot:c44596_g1_i1 orf=1-198(-)